MTKIALRICLGAVFSLALVQAQTPDPRAQMISPAPGSTLPGSTVTFTWSAAGGGGDYFLRMGSVAFGTDIFNAVVRVTSVTLIDLPTNGGTIYVSLYTQLKGNWQDPFQYTYTAANNGTPVPTTISVDNKTVVFTETAQNITLTATVSATPAVDQGTVTFQVTDGASSVGTAVTSGPLTAGTASAIYALPAGTAAKTYGIQAAYAGGSNFQASKGTGALTVSPAPSVTTVTLLSVVNSASNAASSIAPGEIVTLFGAGMGPASRTFYQLDADHRIPTLLAGVRILFGGSPAPLICVSDTQAVAVVPFGVTSLANAEIVAEYNGNVSTPITVPVTSTMPGIFTADSFGIGVTAVTSPRRRGSIMVVYVSGLGPLNPAQADGEMTFGSTLPALDYPVTVTVGGRSAEILYQGPANLAVPGLYQINCIVPADMASGEAAVVVTADGRQSQPQLVTIQ